MPGYSTGKTRSQATAGKRQQCSGEGSDGLGPTKHSGHNKRRCSPASNLPAVGAKRKRSEEGTSECQQSHNAGSSLPHTTGTAPGKSSGSAARSDQQKATKSPDRSSAKPSKPRKREKARGKVLDSDCDPEDEVSLYILAQKHKHKHKPPALLARRCTSREQAHALLAAASRERNAKAAALAAGFLGGGPKSGQGKPAAPLASSSGRAGASDGSPSSGASGLASMIPNQFRHPEARLPPKPPTSHYDIYRQLSVPACHNQEPQLSEAEAPFRGVAESGVASFAYFEPGFVTSRFSVSAFAAESKATMSKLEELVAAAGVSQDPDQPIEAASLRVTPLEERHQAALQASLAEAEKAEADNPVQQILWRHRARSSCSSRAAATDARTLQQLPGSADLPSCRHSGLMLPPPPRPASNLGQVPAGPSPASCPSQGPASQELSLARLPSASEDLPATEAATSLDLPEAQLQRGKHMNGVEPVLLDAPPLVPSTSLASAPQRATSAAAAAAAALPTPPGLPSETAAVAAASDALIATFSAAGTGQAASAAAAAAAAAGGNSIHASAADSSQLPHARQSAQTQAAAPNAAHLSQSQEQSSVTGSVSNSAQSEAGAEADGAGQTSTGEEPGREAAAAAASGLAHTSGPAFRAGGGAGPPQSMDLGTQGRAALAAMPQIGPDSDDEDVSCVNMRYRPRTAAPVKVQTKEQVAQQQKMSEEVRSKWLEGLQAAAKELTSLSMAQETKTGAARKRWDRNVDSTTRLGTAEAFAQRAHRSLQAGRHTPLAVGGNGPFLATYCSQAVGIPPLPGDTVLTFTVHRFDRPGKTLTTVAVLGRQKLTVLRDTIKCEADATLTKNNLSRPSASLYFEGTFYNDMRDESAVDMSYSIRDFLQQQSVKVPPPAPSVPPAYPPACSRPAQDDKSPQSQPRAHKMEETTFDNLFLRVGQGAGYVYMHQGCCEHLVELLDVRSIHHAELLQSQPISYPFVLKEATRHRRDCKVCKMANIDRRADWVTHNDKNAPTNPAFWCDDCYRQMHYDEGGHACYKDYKAFYYMYEYGTFKKIRKGLAETELDEPDRW